MESRCGRQNSPTAATRPRPTILAAIAEGRPKEGGPQAVTPLLRRALELDSQNPDTHFALAEAHLAGDEAQPPGAGVLLAGIQQRLQAEAEGLDQIFKAAGGQWRYAGCSMCLGMNPDQLRPQQRCASTSNRNFEGRQGKGGRTHLVSPEMAAAAAVAGKFVDIRQWLES